MTNNKRLGFACGSKVNTCFWLMKFHFCFWTCENLAINFSGWSVSCHWNGGQVASSGLAFHKSVKVLIFETADRYKIVFRKAILYKNGIWSNNALFWFLDLVYVKLSREVILPQCWNVHWQKMNKIETDSWTDILGQKMAQKCKTTFYPGIIIVF